MKRLRRVPHLPLAGCELQITRRGSLTLEGTAGSKFEFFPEEAARIVNWLSAAIYEDSSETETSVKP
jgi:hypothetical protein